MEKENFFDKEISFNEKRIREITLIYYTRPDIKKILYDFSKNRECIPRYFEGFGKRPDTFQYENDVIEHVRRGATSFHCSEELWIDPLEISTELSRIEFNSLRKGWDLLLDIDSPYLEYSKIYAGLLIGILKSKGVNNIGIKFSGSKGFHIIIPWKSFPKSVYGTNTKDMFPEWPRIICEYISELIRPKLEEEILKESDVKDLAKRTGKKEEDLLVYECNSCKKPAIKKELATWICPNCRNQLIMIKKNKRIPKCPNESCRKQMIEQSSKIIFACEFCNLNSEKNPEYFGNVKEIGLIDKRIISKDRYKTEAHIEADLILVSPRHLFRMPYSLHEKTSLSSVVIDKDKIKDFQIIEAKPFRVQVKNFYPIPKEEEAKHLLLQALDWKEEKEKEEKSMEERREYAMDVEPKVKSSGEGGYKEVIIDNPQENIYPPCIKLILKGITNDGRKRALFILINYFRSLGMDINNVEKRINEWNEKNAIALKKGYIQSQMIWYKRNKNKILPPNCDKPHYKDIGVCKPDEFCKKIKNPASYSIKKHFIR